MNFLIVIVLVFSITATKAGITKEETLEAIRSVIGACTAETGATEADIGVMMKHLPAKNMETKCMRACIMRKFEVMNADGKLDKTNALKMSELHTQGDPERIKIAEAITIACGGIDVPDDQCEAAELYKMCLQSEAMKHDINIMD